MREEDDKNQYKLITRSRKNMYFFSIRINFILYIFTQSHFRFSYARTWIQKYPTYILRSLARSNIIYFWLIVSYRMCFCLYLHAEDLFLLKNKSLRREIDDKRKNCLESKQVVWKFKAVSDDQCLNKKIYRKMWQYW